MFNLRYILFFVTGLSVGLSQGQSVEAGFIAAKPVEVSEAQLIQLSALSCSAAGSGHSGEIEVPELDASLLFEKNLLSRSNGSGANGTSTGGVSGFGSSAAPAALLDVSSLEKSRFFSYLRDVPELKISPPFLDGIFRPPIG